MKPNLYSTYAHFIFTPKYRHPFFADPAVARRLNQLFIETAAQFRIEIVSVAIQPDHVHLLVAVPLTMSFSQVAMRFKWWSSCYIRREFPTIRQHSALWGRHFFVKGISGGRADVRRYIEDQRLDHLLKVD